MSFRRGCDQNLSVQRIRNYLRTAYYPFYKETKRGFGLRLREMADQVLEVDYPAIEQISVQTIRKARRMLMVLASSCPQTPNMSRLYAELETDRNNGLTMLNALADAGLLRLLSSETGFGNRIPLWLFGFLG